MPSLRASVFPYLKAGFVVVVSLISFGGTTVATSGQSGSAPSSADAFVDAIGFDSHFDYRESPYDLEWPKISDQLLRSGIRHLRDGGNPKNPAYLDKLAILGSRGIKHSVGLNIDFTADQIRSHVRAYAPYAEFVEPQNEYDSKRSVDPGWASHLVQQQQLIFSTLRDDPQFSNLTILGPALSKQEYYGELGPLDRYEDAGNLHNAPCNLNPGAVSRHGFVAKTQLLRQSTLSKPIWTTETGYTDDTSRPCAIPDDVIAKYDPRTIAERFNAGEPRIYFYQLVDVPRDRIFGRMGLIDENGDPKPQFTAIASLATLLADPGPPTPLEALDLSIDASAPDVHHTLLENRNHVYFLLLWRELPSWKSPDGSNIGGARIPVGPAAISVRVPGARSFKYFTYDPSWHLRASDPQIAADQSTRIPVTDAISILEIQRGI